MSFFYQDIGKDWAVFQNWTQYVSAAISLTLNSFLIYLIITKSPEKLGAYKYLMISISIYEIAYSVIDVIISPICHSFGSAFLVIVITKNRILPPSALLVLDATYCGFFGFSMAIFVIHFVYRYLVASGSNLLFTFKSYKIGLWLSIPLVVGIVWALVTLFLNGPTDEISEHVRYNVLKSLDLKLDEFVYVGPCFYWISESGEYVVNIKPIIGMIILSSILTSSITLVVFFSVKCYLRIKKMVETRSRVSRTTQNLQTQLFHALVIQTLIPGILMYLPVSVMFLFTFLNIDLGSTSGTATITIALYPAIDPLPNIIIIRHYRQAVCGVFALFANSLLVYLIVFHSPKSLGAYRYLMMYISIFEILYALLDVIVSPVLFTDQSGLIALMDSSKSGIPIQILLVLNILFCGSFGMSMAIFAIHFVFRYLIISGNKTLTSSNPLTVLVWLLIPVAFGTIWSLLCMVFLFPTPEKNKFIQETYLKRFPGRIEDVTYFGPYFYPNGKLDWEPCLGIATCSTLMSISSLTMVFCGIKCYNRINNLVRSASQSNHHKNLHSQFLSALIVETLVPVFLMHIPAAVAYLTCFLNMSNEVIGNILTMSIAMYPAVDPLPTMIIISCYRNAILRFIAKQLEKFTCVRKLVEAMTVSVESEATEMDVL